MLYQVLWLWLSSFGPCVLCWVFHASSLVKKWYLFKALILLILRVFPSMDRREAIWRWATAMCPGCLQWEAQTSLWQLSSIHLISWILLLGQRGSQQPDLSYCPTVMYGLDLMWDIQINIPYNKDMYVPSRISTSSCGSIDEISILRLRELNCEIVREVMPGLITGGVAMPTFQAEDFFLMLWGGCFVVFGFFFCVSPQHTPCLLRLFWGWFGGVWSICLGLQWVNLNGYNW